eukprot:4541083-Amphidinium_carterae.1
MAVGCFKEAVNVHTIAPNHSDGRNSSHFESYLRWGAPSSLNFRTLCQAVNGWIELFALALLPSSRLPYL